MLQGIKAVHVDVVKADHGEYNLLNFHKNILKAQIQAFEAKVSPLNSECVGRTNTKLNFLFPLMLNERYAIFRASGDFDNRISIKAVQG